MKKSPEAGKGPLLWWCAETHTPDSFIKTKQNKKIHKTVFIIYVCITASFFSFIPYSNFFRLSVLADFNELSVYRETLELSWD